MAKPMSVRLSEELVAKLDQMAAAMERSRAWVIQDAVTRYIEDEFEDLLDLKQAMDEIRDGTADLISHEEVMRETEERLRALEARLATPVA